MTDKWKNLRIPNSDPPRQGHETRVMILNDGETYGGMEGCHALVLPRDDPDREEDTVRTMLDNDFAFPVNPQVAVSLEELKWRLKHWLNHAARHLESPSDQLHDDMSLGYMLSLMGDMGGTIANALNTLMEHIYGKEWTDEERLETDRNVKLSAFALDES